MLSFKEITLADKETIQHFTLHSPRRNCDLQFANLSSWTFLYQTEFAVMNDYLLLRFYSGEVLAYMLPVGTGDIRPVLKAMVEDAEDLGSPFRLLGVCTNMRADLEAAMPGKFTFTEDRDYFDYIYLREELASLKGKKLQAKRNHVNKFKRTYPDYEYKELTPALVSECLKLEEEWYKDSPEENRMALRAERRSMTYALKHIDALGISGGVLHVNGRICAFTYGGAINYETWDTCVEKADTNIEGAYAMINYEYANHIPEQYVYVNREEDLGIDGLRKAKLSYKPVILLEKYIAEYNDHKR